MKTGANVVYGAVRLIESEEETLLRWAGADYACIIFNLAVEHSPEGIERAYPRFRRFLEPKQKHDRHGVFGSDRHRHYGELVR